jgi:hypothetical protein
MYLPGGAMVQIVEPATAKCPMVQLPQVLAPAALKRPWAQFVHFVWPALENVPEAHALAQHVVAPILVL